MCFFEPWNILIYDLGYLFIGNPKLDCIWYLSMKYKIQGFFFFFACFSSVLTGKCCENYGLDLVEHHV